MYNLTTYNKIISRIRQTAVSISSKIGHPYLIYRAFWHMKITPPHLYNTDIQYFAAIPNRGAGIGHQMANWIAGYWFAKNFELKFAHIPFSTDLWESFLNFGENEVSVEQLISDGYSIRRLPLFEENDIEQLTLIKRIIASYERKKIVFVAEQDQFYRDQYGIMDTIKSKFFSLHDRKETSLLYDYDNYNIAIHIRRGDIMTDPTNLNLTMRFLANGYYEKVLANVLKRIETEKPIHIWLFSQGIREDYREFEKFPNLHWCLDMNPQDSFLHMVFADLLITSKSSFSYKSALISNGIKVCPKEFWHSYPDTSDWILADNYGNLLN